MSKNLKINVNAEFEFLSIAIETLPPNEDLIAPPPDIQMIKSVIDNGVIQPLICTLYRNKLHVVDGRRRILAVREAFHRVEEDPEFLEEFEAKDLDHLKYLTAKVYKGINPANQAIWSIILNEKRSSNPLSFYQYVKNLQKEGKWDAMQALLRTSKGTVTKHLELDNLIDQEAIFTAYMCGKIAESNMFALAKLNDQLQKYVLAILESEGKIVGKDIKAAKSARTAQAVSTIPFDNIAKTNPVRTEYAVEVLPDGKLFKYGSFNEALTQWIDLPTKERGAIWKRVK